MALTYEELYGIQEKSKKKKKKKDDDIAPVHSSKSKLAKPLAPRVPTSTEMPDLLKRYTPTTTVAPTVTAGDKIRMSESKKSYFDDGYDFGDITRTILGAGKTTVKSISANKNDEEKKATFDEAMRKKYSSMSLADIEKEYSRIKKEEKAFKEKNGGKFINYLAKAGSYLGDNQSMQSRLDSRAESKANIDKIDDLTREKEIINSFRKKRATEEYLGGLSKEQLRLLDNISTSDDLENAAPIFLATADADTMQQQSMMFQKAIEPDKKLAEESRKELYNQLKKKNPKKSEDELNELIDNMVELRKSQVNAENTSSMIMDIQGNGAASEFDPSIEKKVGFATEHPVASFILSRGANFIGGATGLYELYTQRGNEYGLDTNAMGFSLTRASNAIDEQVQLDHDWKIKVGNEDVDAFDLFYSVGSSAVDSLSRLAMAGGNPEIAGAMMFPQVATQSIIEGKEKGYSDSKALTKGLLNATFEALGEAMSLDVVLGSSGGVLKKLAKSLVAEGGEEVTSNWLNRIADLFMSGKHSDLGKMYEFYQNEGLTKAQALTEVGLSVIREDTKAFIEGGLAGVLMSGGFSTANAISNAKQKNAPVELTENEQKVVDKVVEDRIAKATEENDGKAISKREENKIRQAVLRDLEKGYIDTDTIESVLGGEEYENYKKTKDSSDETIATGKELIETLEKSIEELQQEYDELNKVSLTEATLGDKNRQTEIKDKQAKIQDTIEKNRAILEGLENDTRLSDLKTKLGQNVFDLVKDSRLSESYKEIDRHKQVFSADPEQYENEYAKKTIQNALDYRNDEGYGIDNTNASHDFIDLMTKYATDREVEIVFTTTKGLAELKKNGNKYGIKADPNKINALVSKEHKKMFLNMDTGKNLYSLVGHEVTHTVVDAKSLGKLNNVVKAYLGEAEYKKIYDKKAEAYKGLNLKKAEIEEEIVADFCGERLLTDYDFVMHLATNEQNFFQKAWDSIKHLYKMATAGSKEARQLEKAKRIFEKAYRESSKAKADGKTNYSLSAEQEEYFQDSKVRDENGNLKVMYHGTSKGGYTVFDTYGSKYGLFGQGSYFTDDKSVAESYTNKGKGDNKQVYETYLNITNPIDMDAQADVDAWARALPDADFTNCTTNEDCYRAMEEYFEDEQYPKYEASEIAMDVIQSMGYDGITHIGGGRVNADGTKHQVYIAFESEQIKNIDNIAPTKDADIRYSISDIEDSAELPWENNAKDSEGNKLTQKQIDYFEGSQAVDRNGNLLKVYHTTKNDFTVFDKARKGEATEDANTYLGFFFTDDAEYMQNFPEFENGKTESYYLNMKNPIDMTDISEEAFLDIVEVMGGDVDEAAEVYAQELADEQDRAKLRGDNSVSLTLGNLLDTLTGEFYYDDFIRELQPHYDELMSKGYDGVINYMDELFGVKEYIVLDSHQAKLTSNKNPSADADIRYSLSDNLENIGKILYNDNNPLSIVNRAKSKNNSSIGWVYKAEILSVKENKLFHEKISEINQGSEAFSKNSDGEYMLPIENKIVFTDGNYDSPYVREIVEVLTEYQTEFDDIRERIYNVEKGKSDKYETAQTLAKVYGNGIVITYRNGISGVYGWEDGQRKGKTRRTVVRNHLNKQYRAGNDNQSQETPINEIAPIKETSSEDGVFFDAQKTKFSLSEDSKGKKLTKEQQDYFKKVSPLLKDENGNIKRYYHGTARGDRVGTYFNPERATSGPMAFFTDNPEIAEGYSKSKADTSMSYDPDYDSYETQFRVNINGNDMSLINAWRYLPMSAKARIKDRAEHTHYDWEDYETLVYDEETTEANGGFSWQLREARGNVLQALNEQWLNSGTLFREENKYLDVLKFIGVYDEFKKLGYGEPYYKDPFYREEKVFEVYLNVTNPFHTADVDEEFLNDARDWVDNTDLSIYESETADSDLWDKRSLDPYEWLDRLESDIENETTHAWTSIPDVITDFLKEYGGYDGIVDAGGKHTGYGHQVVIPFYSEQIKNIDNETPTTDVHIDLSLSEERETFGDYGNLKVYAKDIMTPTDIAPVSTVSKTEQVEGTVNEDDYAPMTEEQANAMYEADRGYINSFTDADMPPEVDAPIYSADTTSIKEKPLKDISAMGRDILFLTPKERRSLENVVQKYSTSEVQSEEALFNEIKKLFGEKTFTERIEEVYEIQRVLRGYKINVSPSIKRDIADYTHFMRRHFGKITFSKEGLPVDTAYMELSSRYPNFFPSDIINPSDQLQQISAVANMVKDETMTYELDDDVIREATEIITEAVSGYKERQMLKATEKEGRAILRDELSKEKKTANQRRVKQQQYRTQMEALVGDTSTWVDKKLGLSYEVNTLRRNLRDVVRDANGKRDIAKADAIYDELQGKYNHNEAELNREANRIKEQFAELKITKAEDTYIQMLGEFRHNPETTLTEDDVKDFYEKHKKHIDEAKVDKVIKDARSLYDDLLVRVNKVLSEQGMKEIPYRKGYFPHFNEEKQGILGKLFNWKTKNNDIPTSIAGLTEMFEPNRSWQSFNKQRKTDVTDYSFLKGLDTYVQGSLDWVYHIEDIQKRRALENHIRYTHSDEGVKARVDAILNSEVYDADEMQEQIDLVYREANNPLNNFIQDFHTATNSLAGKKSTFDRDLEQKTNRKVYSVMTNLSNRVSGNMVAGSVSSALTNFIPITQSWVEVSPVNSLRAMGETIKSTIRDDGAIDKSDFLTNRLNKSENLYKTNWDKIGEGVSILMDSIDNFTSQTVWRSKYIQNMSQGMSESEAIKNADQFAANVIADRSRGNQPTIFDSKSPVSKIFTAFQLEVNNQYGYLFKDAPKDIKNRSKARLIHGYATAFIGAYAYNALYSSLTGRDAAFDPIGIIEDLLRDLGFGGDDDEEEEIAPVDVALNLTNNILEEVPFIGGLLGGGRIPISSAMPYGGIMEAYEGTLKDISEKNLKSLTKEWLNPVYYLAMPMGGGQIRKTNQGVAMFSDDHPVAGSYTDSGNLRFPVEDNFKNRIQAAVFGQYANENARTYFDEGYAPLKEKQIQEYKDADMPIADYWKYREGLKNLKKQDEKAAYINGLDISDDQKNVLKSYLYDEEGYKEENPEKYAFLEKEGIGYIGYKEADEDTQSAWSWAFKHQDEYEYYKENGVYPGDYSTYYIPMLDFEDDDNDAYSWAFNNPEKATFSKAITDNVVDYRKITSELYSIRADKDRNGKAINGSAKKKKKAYIWGLDIDEEAKYILFKNEYPSFDDKNREIVEYLINRDDLSYDEVNDICEQLGYKVNRDTGDISWD